MLSYLLKIIRTLYERPLLLALTSSVGTITGATFARQLLTALNSCSGGQGARICFWLLGPSLILFLCRKASRRGFASICVALAVILFSRQLPQFEERIHLLQYGIVGFLWTYAFSCRQRRGSSILPAGAGFLAALVTACLDESIQAILPYRVGDFRDIGFDLVGSIAGLSICLLQQEGVLQRPRLNAS